MVRSRDPRKNRDIIFVKGAQRYVKDRRKSQLKGPDKPLEELPLKSGVISKELVNELIRLARELGMPIDEFKKRMPMTMMGGRKKRTQLENALLEKRRREKS